MPAAADRRVDGRGRALGGYPFKSAQGAPATSLDLATGGVVGDRRWALLDANGKLCSAKRYSKLLTATGRDDGALVLDDGVALADDAAFSEWLGHDVRRVEYGGS